MNRLWVASTLEPDWEPFPFRWAVDWPYYGVPAALMLWHGTPGATFEVKLDEWQEVEGSLVGRVVCIDNETVFDTLGELETRLTNLASMCDQIVARGAVAWVCSGGPVSGTWPTLSDPVDAISIDDQNDAFDSLLASHLSAVAWEFYPPEFGVGGQIRTWLALKGRWPALKFIPFLNWGSPKMALVAWEANVEAALASPSDGALLWATTADVPEDAEDLAYATVAATAAGILTRRPRGGGRISSVSLPRGAARPGLAQFRG